MSELENAQEKIIKLLREEIIDITIKATKTTIKLEKFVGAIIGVIGQFGKDKELRIGRSNMMQVEPGRVAITAQIDPENGDLVLRMRDVKQMN